MPWRCWLLGTMPLLKKCVDKACPEPGCVKLIFHAMDDSPFKLIALLRSTPLVPFNLLNYYVGATYRVQLQP